MDNDVTVIDLETRADKVKGTEPTFIHQNLYLISILRKDKWGYLSWQIHQEKIMRELEELTGAKSVPQLFVNERHVGGLQEMKVRWTSHEDGMKPFAAS